MVDSFFLSQIKINQYKRLHAKQTCIKKRQKFTCYLLPLTQRNSQKRNESLGSPKETGSLYQGWPRPCGPCAGPHLSVNPDFMFGTRTAAHVKIQYIRIEWLTFAYSDEFNLELAA